MVSLYVCIPSIVLLPSYVQQLSSLKRANRGAYHEDREDASSEDFAVAGSTCRDSARASNKKGSLQSKLPTPGDRKVP